MFSWSYFGCDLYWVKGDGTKYRFMHGRLLLLSVCLRRLAGDRFLIAAQGQPSGKGICFIESASVVRPHHIAPPSTPRSALLPLISQSLETHCTPVGLVYFIHIVMFNSGLMSKPYCCLFDFFLLLCVCVRACMRVRWCLVCVCVCVWLVCYLSELYPISKHRLVGTKFN